MTHPPGAATAGPDHRPRRSAGPRRRRLTAVLAGLALLLVPAVASAAEPPAFLPIDESFVPLPKGFQANTPVWTTDGEHLLFSSKGDLYVVAQDGSGLNCLSCSLPNRPEFPHEVQEAFKDVFPDGKRALWGDFTHAYVLECAPSLVQCDDRKLLPIDVSAGEPSSAGLSLGSGVWHLSPDGGHLAWTTTRNDTRAMLLGRLQRRDGGYVATDVKVLNPPGPKGPTDTDPRGWTNGGALYELKSFSKGGRAITYVTSQFEGNPDMYEVDLATGARTRLTGNPDWDEDGGESPDGQLLSMYSDRGMHRVDTAGLVPRRSFIDYPISLNAAIYYVGTSVGFQCDLQPWLLPATGDQDGALLGQPLTVYDGGDVHAQNNIPGRGAWSPDSTKVALTEMTYSAAQGTNRLRIARLDREPTAPTPIASSDVGAWASTPDRYRGVADAGRTVTVHGLHSGIATITYPSSIFTGRSSVTYDRYSDDGKSFVSGTESVEVPLFPAVPARNLADIRITGEHTGFLSADFTIGRSLGQPVASGRVTSELDGYRQSGGIQQLGPCPQSLPRRQPVSVKATASRSGTRRVVRVTVTADPGPTLHTTQGFGDRRPVQRARIRVGNLTARTDATGVARVVLPAGAGALTPVDVDAGATFLPGRATVRVPSAPKVAVRARAAAQRLSTVTRGRKLLVRCRADARGRCTATATASRATARRLGLRVPRGAKVRVLGRGSAVVPAGRERTIAVRMSAGVARALRERAAARTTLTVRVGAAATGRRAGAASVRVTIRR